MEILQEARNVFNIEINALEKIRDNLDSVFIRIIDEIQQCDGKVLWIGMGKPGHISRKNAATMSSLGTSSFFLHPAEALHGDLGMISSNDITMIISYSGESDEVTRLLPNIKLIGAKIIAITGNADSTLAKASDIVEVFPAFNEACHMGLAPTSSTTAALVYGDALAVVLSELSGFSKVDFGKFHPAGSLGKQILMKVSDVMLESKETAVVDNKATLKQAIVEMSRRGLSIVTAVHNGQICGILTDGDLRRLLENNVDIYQKLFSDVMTMKPTIISKYAMAVDALNILRDNRYSAMPVVDEKNMYQGIVTLHSIVKAGIV
jgi:arabinose-5-phosphate isomerase